jgi:hypothetical protein
VILFGEAEAGALPNGLIEIALDFGIKPPYDVLF